jgi:hypothetical protein
LDLKLSPVIHQDQHRGIVGVAWLSTPAFEGNVLQYETGVPLDPEEGAGITQGNGIVKSSAPAAGIAANETDKTALGRAASCQPQASAKQDNRYEGKTT